MPHGLGKLGDLFPEKKISCRIRGCENLVLFSGDEAMEKAANGNLDRRQMCEECFQLYNKLADQEVPCSNPECSDTWVWTRFQQLESRRRGFQKPPDRLCEACRKKAGEMEDKAVPCRVRACTRTWTWTAEQQTRAGGGAPPERFCEQCWQRFRDLSDKQVPCRMKGCEQTWPWKRFHQLEHLAEGKSLDDPPKRMCSECFKRMKELTDRELPCKADECERTWTWNSYAQVEHERLNGPDAEPPSKLCPECYRFFRSTHDRQLRCQNRGCANTWTYTRGMQLHDWLNNVSSPAPQMCESCQKYLEESTPREVECMVQGCPNTWTYSAVEQTKDHAAGRHQPSARRCERCTAFLAKRKPESLTCAKCGGEFTWSTYEQLLNALGTFAKPTICSECAEHRLAGDSGSHIKPPPRNHHHVVRMPAAGKWAENPRISPWPPHLTHEDLGEAEQAELRIVALGDDLVYSRECEETMWPKHLEALLNEKQANGRTVKVINAGMPETGSELGRLRCERDVFPFAPHLVIVSFVLGDSFLPLDTHSGQWRASNHERNPEGLTHLLEKLAETGAGMLYAILNPVLPAIRVDEQLEGQGRKWADAQDHEYKQCAAHHTRICSQKQVPVVDLRPRFEVNGKRTVRRWMADWQNHNEQGARNIAVWLRDAILRNELLPAE
ncbi:MAG: SGNH/GDSL hydrolase family protein [Verrucomicrobiota bacterium]